MVRTNDLEVFLRELFADASQVHRGIVRLTYEHHPTPAGIRRVVLRATARIAGELLVLEMLLGVDGGEGTPGRERIQEVGGPAEERIKQACAGLNLELRGATYA